MVATATGAQASSKDEYNVQLALALSKGKDHIEPIPPLEALPEEIQEKINKANYRKCFTSTLEETYAEYIASDLHLFALQFKLLEHEHSIFQMIIDYYFNPSSEVLDKISVIVKEMYYLQNKYFEIRQHSYEAIGINKFCKELEAIIVTRDYDIEGVKIHTGYHKPALALFTNIQKNRLAKSEVITSCEQTLFKALQQKLNYAMRFNIINKASTNPLQYKIFKIYGRIPFLADTINIQINSKIPYLEPTIASDPITITPTLEAQWNKQEKEQLLYLQATQIVRKRLLNIIYFTTPAIQNSLIDLLQMKIEFYTLIIKYLTMKDETLPECLKATFLEYSEAINKLLNDLEVSYEVTPIILACEALKKAFIRVVNTYNAQQLASLVDVFTSLIIHAQGKRDILMNSRLIGSQEIETLKPRALYENQERIVAHVIKDHFKHLYCIAGACPSLEQANAILNDIVNPCSAPDDTLDDAIDTFIAENNNSEEQTKANNQEQEDKDLKLALERSVRETSGKPVIFSKSQAFSYSGANSAFKSRPS